LPPCKSLPRESGQFFVTCSKQAYIVEHFGQESSDIHSSTESKEVDVIVWRVIPHEKLITPHHVLVERSTNGGVLGLLIPRVEACRNACVRKGCADHVGSDSRLIIVKLLTVVSIEHSIDLQDVTVRGVPREFIASSIKAKDESLLRSLMKALPNWLCRIHRTVTMSRSRTTRGGL